MIQSFKIQVIIVGLAFLTGCNFWPTTKVETINQNFKLEPKSYAVASNSVSQLSSSTLSNEVVEALAYDASFFDKFYSQTKNVPDIGPVRGGILPHHLLAGYLPATFFRYLEKQQPSTIVVFAPNHKNSGGAKVISSDKDWQTPFGNLAVDRSAVATLSQKGIVKLDDPVLVDEHSITSLVPFIKKSLPNTKIIPLVMTYKIDDKKVDELLKELRLILPSDAVVGTVDFSHYQTWAVANYHDNLSEAVIDSFDFGRLKKTEVDSPAVLFATLKLLESLGAQKVSYKLHDNSANISGDKTIAETTSYYVPFFVEGGPTKTKIASILTFGDLMLDRNVKSKIDKFGSDYLFIKLAGEEQRFFTGVDDIMANLEGPFADKRRPTSKSIAFRFDPSLIPMLKEYNFTIFSQANNHSLDMGQAGFDESLINLRKNVFFVFGNQYVVNDNSLLFKKVGDYNIAFIGLNETNSASNFNKVKNLILKGRQGGAEYVVVSIHWGDEYKEISASKQRVLAHKLIDEGVDVIIGHHPHVVQEMEIYKNRPIFYSLGNFVFDQYFSTPTQQGLSIGLVFRDKEISAYVFPLQGDKSQVEQMKGAVVEKYFANWTKKSRLGNFVFDNFEINLKI